MRKLVVLVALAALAAPANALAKEISGAKICGASGCVTSTDKDALMQVVQSSAPVPERAPGPAPYYKVTFRVTEPGHGPVGGWDAWFVPSAGLLSTRGESGAPEWSALDDPAVAFLEGAVAALQPFPTPRFTRVLVGTRPVRDPNSYRALFTPAWPLVADSASDWKPITIDASAHNPWTDGVQVLYSPSKNVVWRGADRVHVPARIAANIEARRSLRAPGQSPNRAWAWAAGAAALVGVVAATVVRRRRAQPRYA
jgi:hypothetical protein